MSKQAFTQHHSTAWLAPMAMAMSDLPMLAINRRAQCLVGNPVAVQKLALQLDVKNRYVLPKSMRQTLVEAVRQQLSETQLTARFAGLNRTFNVRILYPQRGRQAIGLLLKEVAMTANDQLRRMHTIAQNLINLSPDLICIKDQDNRWMMANESLLKTFAIDCNDYQFLNNLQIAEQIHPIFRNSLEHHERSDAEAWQTGQTYQNEEVVYLPDGHHKILEVQKFANFDEASEPSHLIMVARDVTGQRATEKQLKHRSSVLDSLIDCDRLLHSAERWQNVAETVLQHCCQSFHFSRAVLLQHHFGNAKNKREMRSQALYDWSVNGFNISSAMWGKVPFLSPYLKHWHSALSQGKPVSVQLDTLAEEERKLLKCHDAFNIVLIPLMIDGVWWGSVVLERCFEIEAVSEQELGALMAVGRTFSVAIDREQTGRHLKLAKIAFDSTSEGIMIVNTSGEILGVNQGYTQITGFSEDEVLGQKSQIFRDRPAGFLSALKRKGKWIGEIENFRKSGEKYLECLNITAVRNHTNIITNYVAVVADITEIKRSQHQLNALVNHDPLTGLPNRRLINQLFNHSLQRATRQMHQTAVLFIDLDRFKNINDSLGHHAGDQLLLTVTERIRGSLRECDIVGRLGGDEFIVMLENLQDKADAGRKAQDILNALKSQFTIQQHEIYVGASIGIAMFPEDGNDVDSLIKAADLAMYQVKNNGKNHYSYYSAALSRDAVEHFQLENELRQALSKQQLRVFYQAQIDLNTGLIVGAEALLRWQHPIHGLIPPSKFIGLAEESGLVLSIGEWTLSEAVNQANIWHRIYPEFEKIAINVSAVQIMKSQFADTVYGILVNTDCDSSMVELEITETTLMQNTEHVVNTFHQLKQLGVKIAIDDFGTGYSSLAHLKRLPLDQLKIDRSFVKDLPDDKDDAAITSAIYAMATQLGFTVVAEGVETEEQEQFLQRLGCQTAQGYLYAYPVPAEAFEQLLALNNQRKLKRHA